MSTSKLQIAVGEMLDSTFPEFSIKENYRPDWLKSSSLTNLELDYYIEELSIGLEIQGAQHYQFVPFFHGSIENFDKRKLYDQEKKDLCYGNGIKLFEIDTLTDAIVAIKDIEEIAGNRPMPEEQLPIKKDKNDPIVKYLHDERYARKHRENLATRQQKADEIKQFKKKVRKFKENSGKGKRHDLPYFKFNYLSLREQGALLEEYGILGEIQSRA